LRQFSACDACYDARAARLQRMNLEQAILEPVRCGACA
jgi:hypothetical protein